MSHSIKSQEAKQQWVQLGNEDDELAWKSVDWVSDVNDQTCELKSRKGGIDKENQPYQPACAKLGNAPLLRAVFGLSRFHHQQPSPANLSRRLASPPPLPGQLLIRIGSATAVHQPVSNAYPQKGPSDSRSTVTLSSLVIPRLADRLPKLAPSATNARTHAKLAERVRGGPSSCTLAHHADLYWHQRDQPRGQRPPTPLPPVLLLEWLTAHLGRAPERSSDLCSCHHTSLLHTSCPIVGSSIPKPSDQSCSWCCYSSCRSLSADSAEAHQH